MKRFLGALVATLTQGLFLVGAIIAGRRSRRTAIAN